MREFKPDQVQQSQSLSQICSAVHWPPHWILKDWVCAFVLLACLKSQEVGRCAIITCVRASMTSPLAAVVQRVEGKEVGVPLNRLWLCSCLKTLIFSLAQKAEEMNLLALFAVNSRHKGTKLCRVLQAKWIWREKMEFNKKIFESKVHRAFIYLTPVADTVKAPCVAYITPSGEWS